LLRFDGTGGFVPVQWALTELIEYSLYSDGRVVVGESSGGSPTPAVRAYAETRVDDLTVVEFLGLIEQLGIADFADETNNEMQNFVADAETNVVEYFDEEGGVHRYSVYALGMSDFEDADGRVAVTRQIAEAFRSIDISDARPLPIDRLQVWIGEVAPDSSYHTVRPWQFAFPTIQTDSSGFEYTCIELTGDDAAVAVDTLQSADSTTLWSEGDVAYSVVARPLLEWQTGCENSDY